MTEIWTQAALWLGLALLLTSRFGARNGEAVHTTLLMSTRLFDCCRR